MSNKTQQPPDGVEPIPFEPLRFRVRSRSRPKVWHLVDVEESVCSCEQYDFRIGPRRKIVKAREYCWHLRQARDACLDDLLKQIKNKRDKSQPLGL